MDNKQIQEYCDENIDLDRFEKMVSEYKFNSDLLISNQIIDLNMELIAEIKQRNIGSAKSLIHSISERAMYLLKKYNSIMNASPISILLTYPKFDFKKRFHYGVFIDSTVEEQCIAVMMDNAQYVCSVIDTNLEFPNHDHIEESLIDLILSAIGLNEYINEIFKV